MARPCEICQGLAVAKGDPSVTRRTRLRRILLGDRIVALCDAHADEVRAAAPARIDELRALFFEPGGRRSVVSRRAPLDRRVFPPRPEGRRRSDGRRATDGD